MNDPKYTKQQALAIAEGAIFDLLGFLTTRKERLVLSSSDDAAPVVEAVEEFIAKRQVDDDDVEPLSMWYLDFQRRSVNEESS